MKKYTVLAVIVFACAEPKKEIERAVANYDRLIERVDAPAIANCFLENGEMGEVNQMRIVGKDSIQKLLSSLANVKVLSNKTDISQIKIEGDSAFFEGKFKQTAVIAPDTFYASGAITGTWVKVGNEWKIRRLYTKSDPISKSGSANPTK